jgi:hypothetical protein
VAKRTKFDDVVIDDEGNGLADVQVNVYEVGTVTPATIYTTRAGVGTKSNPFITTPGGLVQFYADPGTYDVVFSDTEIPERVSDRTITWEAISGDDEGISLAQLPLSIPAANLAAGAALANLANDSITGAKIAAGAIGYGELASMPYANLGMSGDQSIPNGGVLFSNKINWGVASDPSNMHDPGVNPSRVTVPYNGTYLVTANVEWDQSGSGMRGILLSVDGSNTFGYGDINTTPSGSFDQWQSVAGIFGLVAGQYITLGVTQSSGGALDVLGVGTQMHVRYLSP